MAKLGWVFPIWAGSNHLLHFLFFSGEFVGVSGYTFAFLGLQGILRGRILLQFLRPPSAATVILSDASLRLNGCRLLSESFVVGILSGA